MLSLWRCFNGQNIWRHPQEPPVKHLKQKCTCHVLCTNVICIPQCIPEHQVYTYDDNESPRGLNAQSIPSPPDAVSMLRESPQRPDQSNAQATTGITNQQEEQQKLSRCLSDPGPNKEEGKDDFSLSWWNIFIINIFIYKNVQYIYFFLLWCGFFLVWNYSNCPLLPFFPNGFFSSQCKIFINYQHTAKACSPVSAFCV